jgi:hypothetical protein
VWSGRLSHPSPILANAVSREISGGKYCGAFGQPEGAVMTSLTRIQLLASTRPLVVIESPYSGDIMQHILYAQRAMRDSIGRGEAPIASHLLYTQPNVLNDGAPDERFLGIACGFAWNQHAELVAVYQDYGISPGMQLGIEQAIITHQSIVYRSIGLNPPRHT